MESELLKKRGKKDKFIPGHGKESALMNDLDKEVPNPKVSKEECPAHVEEVSILKRHKDVGKHGDNYISERIKESALMNDLDKKVPNPKVSKVECPAHVEEVSILKHHKDVGKHGDNYISERIKEESVFLKKCGKVPSQKEESVFLKKCGKVPSQKVTKEECIAGYLQINEDIPLHVMVDMKIGIRDIILIYQAEGFEENVRDLRNSLSRNMQPKDTKVAHALINACKASMGINSYWNEVKLETVVSLFLLIAKLATVLGAKPGQILDLSKAEIQTLGNSESATVGYCSKGSV